ncbi:MAG: hypothetical protein CML20_05275 [Rheinheimera sp.]|uniref:protein YgfX n=1 Tax=Arsukibacterium sp. UBA3155 TaxID=1946058 RepID=UPI000C8FFE92|nr:protein YgfX [Arsukibacterium sp. UBA3155]MAD74198.1 hypothetical protein [Rheinheimera sp.]
MSGCNVVIGNSVWRQRGILALAVMVFLLFVLQPLPGVAVGLAAPLLFVVYWYGIRCYRQPRVATGLSLQPDGQLQWWHSKLPGGQLREGCLVSEFGVLVRWQCQHAQLHLQWLLADQLTAADYRALARQLNQFNWQRAAITPSDN